MIISVARKRHFCELCSRWVKKGSFYYRVPKEGAAFCLPCKRRLDRKEVRR